MSDESKNTNEENTQANTEESTTENVENKNDNAETTNSSDTEQVENDTDDNRAEVIDEMDALNAEQLIAKVKQAQQKPMKTGIWLYALKLKWIMFAGVQKKILLMPENLVLKN